MRNSVLSKFETLDMTGALLAFFGAMHGRPDCSPVAKAWSRMSRFEALAGSCTQMLGPQAPGVLYQALDRFAAARKSLSDVRRSQVWISSSLYRSTMLHASQWDRAVFAYTNTLQSSFHRKWCILRPLKSPVQVHWAKTQCWPTIGRHSCVSSAGQLC